MEWYVKFPHKGNMIEVEVKLKINSIVSVREYLENSGFLMTEALVEKDFYYDNAEGFIKDSDSALRIRSTQNKLTGEQTAAITFKGPKLEEKTMTRPEYETKIGEATVLDNILRSLGFSPVEPVVKKSREQYTRDNLNACLDVVDGLGEFLELEILVDDSDKDTSDKDTKYQKALAIIEEELKLIGYSMEDTTNISYLTQLQNKIRG